MKQHSFYICFIIGCFLMPSSQLFSQSAKLIQKEKDSIAKAFQPPPGKVIVYVVRSGIVGAAIPMRLDCDTFLIGWISAKTYLYTVIDSGEHTFKERSENEFYLKLNLESGKIYYLEQEAKMGFAYARTKLKLLTDSEGSKILAKRILSIHNRYPAFPNSKDVEREPPSGED